MAQARWEEAREAACAAAVAAWEAIAPLYESGSHVEDGPDGPSTEADKLADRLIREALERDFPRDRYGFLTEETRDDRTRLERDRVWIVDPIDGTKDFIKKNGAFAMHVGYAERLESGKWEAVAAAVYRPFPGEMYSAVRGAGSRIQSFANNRPEGAPREIRVSTRAGRGAMKAVISNSHRNAELDALVEAMGFAEILSIGSVGIKMSLIARGDFDVYVNLARGRCKEWDICAPELILSEAGGLATGLDGSPFHYNRENVRDTAGILGSNGASHEELIARIAEIQGARS